MTGIKQCSTVSTIDGKPCLLHDKHVGSCNFNDELSAATGTLITGHPETINHPLHYGGDTTYEAIKVIEAWGLGFCLGNAVKYIARAEHKNASLEDLRKSLWYLQREIDQREAGSK